MLSRQPLTPIVRYLKTQYLNRVEMPVKCSWEIKTMNTISMPAHFNGECILLDEPFELEPNTKLIVPILPKRDPNMNLGRACLEKGSNMRVVKTKKSIRLI
jgi:hypothetical protein